MLGARSIRDQGCTQPTGKFEDMCCPDCRWTIQAGQHSPKAYREVRKKAKLLFILHPLSVLRA